MKIFQSFFFIEAGRGANENFCTAAVQRGGGDGGSGGSSLLAGPCVLRLSGAQTSRQEGRDDNMFDLFYGDTSLLSSKEWSLLSTR